MEFAKMIFEFVGKLLWPATVMTIVLLFRKYLIQLIPNIRTVKAGGIELSIEKVKEIAEATAKEAGEKVVKEELMFQDGGPVAVASYKQGNRDGASTMLAFAAGKSFSENLKYNIYYDPAYRNHALPFDYIGLYKDGEIRLVGKVSKIVYCDYKNGELFATYDDDLSHLTKDEYTRIKGIIEETKYYDLTEDTKFFLVDQFYETHLICDTVIRGKQYFWLDEYNGFKPGMNAQDLAELLSDHSPKTST
jgi:hypothetical protein